MHNEGYEQSQTYPTTDLSIEHFCNSNSIEPKFSLSWWIKLRFVYLFLRFCVFTHRFLHISFVHTPPILLDISHKTWTTEKIGEYTTFKDRKK